MNVMDTAHKFFLNPPPTLPNSGDYEPIERGVAFELPRNRETEMADAVMCDTLGEVGEVEVRMVDGVRQHTVTANRLRGYVAHLEPLSVDPSRIRLHVTRFSPLGLGVERTGVLAGLVSAVAFLGYVVLYALDQPSLPAWILLVAPIGAMVAYFLPLLLAWLIRQGIERAMGPPIEDETLVGIASELRASLGRERLMR